MVSIPRWHETNACTVTPLLEALHHWKTYKPDKKLAFHSFVALNLWSLLTTVELNICHAKGNHLSIIGYSWQMSIKMELNDTQTQISQKQPLFKSSLSRYASFIPFQETPGQEGSLNTTLQPKNAEQTTRTGREKQFNRNRISHGQIDLDTPLSICGRMHKLSRFLNDPKSAFHAL